MLPVCTKSEIDHRKDIMRKEMVWNRDFQYLNVTGLLFCPGKFFFQIALPFAGRLWNRSVFTKILGNIIIIHSIIHQRQYRTYRDHKDDEYGHDIFQNGIISDKDTHLKCYEVLL